VTERPDTLMSKRCNKICLMSTNVYSFTCFSNEANEKVNRRKHGTKNKSQVWNESLSDIEINEWKAGVSTSMFERNNELFDTAVLK
jgi:hypothetical protein